MLDNNKNISIYSKFSAIPSHKARKNSKEWVFLGAKRKFNAEYRSNTMDRVGGFREKGVKTYHYKFVGTKS